MDADDRFQEANRMLSNALKQLEDVMKFNIGTVLIKLPFILFTLQNILSLTILIQWSIVGYKDWLKKFVSTMIYNEGKLKVQKIAW